MNTGKIIPIAYPDTYVKYSTEYVQNKIMEIPDGDNKSNSLDKSTGLHIGHIKDGKVGKWRDFFSKADSQAITNECLDYLDKFKYDI